MFSTAKIHVFSFETAIPQTTFFQKNVWITSFIVQISKKTDDEASETNTHRKKNFEVAISARSANNS